MEECSFVDEIKTETPVDDTKSEILTEKRRVSIKNELLDDEEQTSKKNRDYDQAGEDRQYVEIEECDEIIPNDRLKKELENSSKAEPSGCGNKGISAPCSIKREYDCDFNEEIEIKNDSDVEHIITSENSSQSCSDDEHSDQSEEGMEDGTYTLENEDVIEDKLDKLKKFRRKEHIGRNVDKPLNEFKVTQRFLVDHRKNKHGNGIAPIFKCECDNCDYSTRQRSYLVVHMKKKHSNEIAAIFKCESCDFVTKYNGNLRKHIDRVHSNIKKYKCHKCDFATTRRCYLVDHRKNKHCDEIFKCESCQYTSEYKGNLGIHIHRVHSNIIKKYKCHECDFATTRRCYLVYHRKNKHCDEIFKCESCQYTSNYKGNLRKHIDRVHSNIKKYKCRKCDFATTLKCYLVGHKKNKHCDGIAAIFNCESCHYISKCRSSLRRHIKRHHLNFNEYKCDNCDFLTTQKSYLIAHIKIQHPNEISPIFKCDSCDFITKYKGGLNLHKKKIHLKNRRYECGDCDYSTVGRDHLVAHRNNKHSNDITRLDCDVYTRKKLRLNDHMRLVHVKEKYECKDCDYSTAFLDDLTTHRALKHLTELNCNLCDFTTKYNSEFKRHIESVHF